MNATVMAMMLVFMAAMVVTAMINYPKNFGEIFAKVGPMYLNIIVILLAVIFGII
ncbi:hypothetical protein [Dorea longicatena]|uniref:hypothetical protein n=1 Tax=Dorea longicatena TaxID=88431 RepID=UPI0036F26E2C